MARRKINSIEDIVEFTAQVPWWVGVVAAMVSAVALFGIAHIALPAAQVADSALSETAVPVLRGLTMTGMVLLPLLFLAVPGCCRFVRLAALQGPAQLCRHVFVARPVFTAASVVARIRKPGR